MGAARKTGRALQPFRLTSTFKKVEDFQKGGLRACLLGTLHRQLVWNCCVRKPGLCQLLLECGCNRLIRRERITESESGIYAAGTFRIAGEGDESKQPMFNLAEIVCEKQADDVGGNSNVKLRRLLYGLNQVSRTLTSRIVRSTSTLLRFE